MQFLSSPLTPLAGFNLGSAESGSEAGARNSFASWTEGLFTPSPTHVEPTEPAPTERSKGPAFTNRKGRCSCCPLPHGEVAGHATATQRSPAGSFLSHLPTQTSEIVHARRRAGSDVNNASFFCGQWQALETAERWPALSSLDRGHGSSKATCEWASAVHANLDMMDKQHTVAATRLRKCIQRSREEAQHEWL